MPTIKVPPVLRQHTDGEAEVSVEGATVGDALRAFAEKHPATREQLFSPDGDLNRYVNVYLNDEDVRVLGGLETEAADSDTVVILPAMAGGMHQIAAAGAANTSRGCEQPLRMERLATARAFRPPGGRGCPRSASRRSHR